ncbi:Tn3 family transposase, partial [Escherichia coli]|nr:Tn3 family transposase [Escherichia coli]
MPAFEWVHVQLHQQKGMISLSPPTICNSANDIARGQSDPRKIVLQWDEMIRTAGSLKLGKVQVSVLVRSLLKSERPSGLTQAIIEVGRINKTLYLLNYI